MVMKYIAVEGVLEKLKRVVSVSLGSSNRDHRVEVELAGESFEISRRGTNGDFKEAIRIIKELDGKVDAIGLGGIDVYIYAGKQRYALADGLKLLRAAKTTPVVDGSGLKNTLERETVHYLLENTDYIRPGSKVLMVSAVDRFGMAEALTEAGCDMIFGDLIFALGIDRALKTVDKLESLARKLLPVISRLPFKMLYPTGKKQDFQDYSKVKKFGHYYLNADIIAGDFHYIKKYFPPQLEGKVIITNTTTRDDLKFLKDRGVATLITTTPVMEGRSFGTNVMEGVLVVLAGKPWEEISVNEYKELLQKLEFKPQIINLREELGAGTA